MEGEKHEGKQYIIKDAPLGVCPIYIKEKSIIPTYDIVQYVGEKPYDKLTLLTTPGEAKYIHYQDNGEDYKFLEGEYNLYEFETDNKGNLNTNILHKGYREYTSVSVVRI